MADGNITVTVNARDDEVQALVAEVERLRSALCELVALQDLQASLPAWPFPNDPDAEARADYKRRWPAAWEVARRALAPNGAISGTP